MLAIKAEQEKILDFWACNHLYGKQFLKEAERRWLTSNLWPYENCSEKHLLWQASVSWAPAGNVGGEQTGSSLSLCVCASCAPKCHLEWFLFMRKILKRCLKYKFCRTKPKSLKQNYCCTIPVAQMKSIHLVTFKGERDIPLEKRRLLGKVQEKPKWNEQ